MNTQNKYEFGKAADYALGTACTAVHSLTGGAGLSIIAISAIAQDPFFATLGTILFLPALFGYYHGSKHLNSVSNKWAGAFSVAGAAYAIDKIVPLAF